VFTSRAAHVALRIDSCFCFHAPIVSKPRENASTKKIKKRFDFLARGGLHVPCQKIMSRKK
jgi:hypothetical protein